ncbi:MAG: GNAT family N-acetyltransferase [Pseudomonadota bacterium]
MNLEITAKFNDYELSCFEWMVVQEWPEVALPLYTETRPILAKIGDAVVGGLSFAEHKHPEKSTTCLWINSLLVLPQYRGQGLGSALVAAAMKTVSSADELFVFTNVPGLYQKLLWEVVKSDASESVLRFVGRST